MMDDAVRGDKKLKALIIGALRRVWNRQDIRRQVLAKVRIEQPVYNKDGSVSRRPSVFYQCSLCGQLAKEGRATFSYPKIQVDHIDPVVPLEGDLISWDAFIWRLFEADEAKLQAICSECHLVKSVSENKQRRLARRGRQK